MIDLHVHSSRSDGTFTPRELVDYAMEKGLGAFALTDHDTVDGLEEAIFYARGLEKAPLVIPGIEFSTEYEGQDVHIVGLAIDYKNPSFTAYLAQFVDSRTTRNQKMCTLLRDAGIDITYEKLQEEFPGAVITRAHYAKYLLNHGYIQNMKEAFERYVGDHCPCYVPREKVHPEMAVELILQAGGIPILAHPMLYRMSGVRLETLVSRLKDAGLIGIEAIYSTYNAAEERQVRALAGRYHLLVSGGSDFHGANKPGLDLGFGYGNLFVPDGVWTDLEKSRRNILFTDMDGTLLKNDSTISPAMRAALARMTDRGHHLVLSSGRPLPSILEVRREAGLEFPNMFIISNNGALIYDCDRRRPILECRVCGQDAAFIVEKARAAGIHIHGYAAPGRTAPEYAALGHTAPEYTSPEYEACEIVCSGMNEELRYYTRRIHLPLKCVEDLASALSEGSYKLQIIHLTDRSVLERFRDELLMNSDLGERVQMIFSNDQYLEVLPKEAGKGRAIKFVADYLPVLRTHTYAAGDAENDISMMEAAHVGIAMKNAPDAVKQYADIVTEGTNDEDGLLEVIEQILAE